jgi:hypothetical protein
MHAENAEYSLAELVQDPLIGFVMKSDGVDPRSIQLLFEQIARLREPDFGRQPGQNTRSSATCCGSPAASPC